MPVRRLREALRLAVEASSLRAVARDVGITPMGLRYILAAESTPQTATLHKLEAWYHELPEATVRAVLALALLRIPKAKRERAMSRMIAALAEVHREAGAPLPGWMNAAEEPVNE